MKLCVLPPSLSDNTKPESPCIAHTKARRAAYSWKFTRSETGQKARNPTRAAWTGQIERLGGQGQVHSTCLTLVWSRVQDPGPQRKGRGRELVHLARHSDLNSNPQHSCKKAAWPVGTCDPVLACWLAASVAPGSAMEAA